jgi:hypothetical protein
VLTMKETLWKNTCNFVKDVHISFVNFIIIVIIVSEKKYKALLVYRPSHFCL